LAALIECPNLDLEPGPVEILREKSDHRLGPTQAQLENEVEDAVSME
jgi:hypothetical protein